MNFIIVKISDLGKNLFFKKASEYSKSKEMFSLIQSERSDE